MRRNNFFVLLVWLLIFACLLGSMLALLSGKVRLVRGSDFEIISRYAKIEAMRDALVRDYYREVDGEALLDAAIDGMLSSLQDPYTFYYTPENMERHDNDLNRIYHGIGILLQVNDRGEAQVVRVYKNSLAEDAGVQLGDIILKVDGVEVSAADNQEFKDLIGRIKGEDGTVVRLLVKRDEGEIELSVERGSVASSNVAWSMLDGSIGYISILQFSGDAVEGFRDALTALGEAGMRGLIIDLRDNPGGILEDVVAIADDLLPEGLIVYTENRTGERTEYNSDKACLDVPIAVLVNDMSASASEILAAAVQDHSRGAVVGTQTYGKGIVQAMLVFPEDGSGMQYTNSAYFTPNGKSIHGSGVTPDILVDGIGSTSLSGIPDLQNDAQLLAAIEYLNVSME